MAVAGVLVEELRGNDTALGRRLAEGVLRFVDHVTLAASGFDRGRRLSAADAELRTLRAHLLLAFELGLLGEETFLAVSEQADSIGRQLGGWRKKLERGPSPADLSLSRH
jgi:hypothetical protein